MKQPYEVAQILFPVLLTFSLLASLAAPGQVTFEDVTEHVGLSGLEDQMACWGDFNNDGYADLHCGATLWRNDGGTGFTGLTSGTERGSGGPSIWGDYDNDGYLDIFDYDLRELYRNESGKGFTEIPLPELPAGTGLGGCWADYNGDGFLDLYLGAVQHGVDTILLSTGDGAFKVTEQQLIKRYARGVTSCDYDEDGDQDVYVSNYWLQPNILWQNDGTGTFGDVASVIDATGGQGHSIGSAWGDIDNDGYFDLFAGNFAHPGQHQSRFLKNLGPTRQYHFQDKGQCGVAYQESYGSPALSDYDNDGDLDLYFTTVYPGDSCVLYRNDSNPSDPDEPWEFTDVTAAAGLAGLKKTYQACWADFDNDGDLDLATDGKLFRNTGNANHSLKVHLAGTGSAIGAKATVALGGRTLTRQVEGGTGEGNQNELTMHFGLGPHAAPIELLITWPNGQQQAVTTPVDRLVKIVMPNESAQ